MITCPDCGLEASDGAKFCDRCGRGLNHEQAPAWQSASRPTPLEAGTEIAKGYKIEMLIDQDSVENRYRASRTVDNKSEKFRLRERIGPSAGAAEETPQTREAAQAPAPAATIDPHAKTAELKLPTASANGEAMADAKRQESQSEPATASPAAAAPEASASSAEATIVEGRPAVSAESAEQAAEPAQSEVASANGASASGEEAPTEIPDSGADLGDIFGRVRALSITLDHPAFERSVDGFAHQGRVYLAYRDDAPVPLTRSKTIRRSEPEAIAIAVQVCQAVTFLHRRGLRLNDICPSSIAISSDGRVRVTGLDYVSNDNELQGEPIFNDGYTAPEIYRGKKVDKRADVFSVGALLYTLLTGDRIESETWREESGTIKFYPPYVVSPELEQAVRKAVAFSPPERWSTIDEMKTELLRLTSEVTIRSAAVTDVGMVRELNEDSIISVQYFRDSKVEPARNFLYSVCDGMGGAEAGETASAIAVGTIRDFVEAQLKPGAVIDTGAMVAAALEEANRKIIEYQQVHAEARGMGSTGVAVFVTPPDCAVGWVGDSRVYLMSSGKLRQVTKDHSLVQRLVEIGQITAEEARTHEHKNVITRSLGARQSGPAGAESTTLKLRRGDRILLCSDGLTTHVEDRDLAAIIQRHDDPYDAARELIAAANAGGGTDNISVILVFAS
ncbi:MAG TPA: Stp1/IreP family PP2C-type Ser/Thr phosphatase [Candidatus Binataceae bacterium]|nr:Stp1/IreP family PP2C-type Ser/Thr phosphatase [Candidatus Binataceae bacterium]